MIVAIRCRTARCLLPSSGGTRFGQVVIRDGILPFHGQTPPGFITLTIEGHSLKLPAPGPSGAGVKPAGSEWGMIVGGWAAGEGREAAAWTREMPMDDPALVEAL